VRLGLPRTLSAAVVVIALVLGLVASGWALQGPATKFINRLPSLTQKLRSELDHGGLTSTVQPVQEAANELKRAADGDGERLATGVTRVQVEQTPTRLSDVLWQGTVSVFQVGIQTSMVAFLVFYLLASGDRYRQKLIDIAGPSVFRRHLTVEILNRIIAQVERFLVARLIISVIVGIATAAVLAAFGMSQPGVWGLVAGVLNNIPYVGPTTAVGGIALAALVQFGRLEIVAAIAGAAAGIAMLEGFALTPWIMGRAGRMNTGAVFVSLIFWGWVWGIWGMLLAVPMMMTIKAICDQIDVLRPVGELLGE
jgi:predicted PurR-regulated permease PerM